ncbi:type II secretion system secretin GspD [Paucibacter sp. Y2R2-4]|uniref:type II secretion system secretin GspD n=1 Tax=Paucibacter sp. Y2R2-4 TaxID=2893553 RepID=UPI0021E45525|nr:type II secretion system secretin GspD [Paucibacter sp. Y2R2-4]MCV2350054.1 type II secretion system secretin GspD [Paucibacter sp. Y2R2-4]
MNKRPRIERPARQASPTLAGVLALSVLASPVLAQTDSNRANNRAHSPALKSGTPVTLNFVNADIEAVTRAIGVMLDRQFIIDPRVKGQITLYSEQPLSVREAYLNYLAALRGLGFTVVENTGMLKVVPEADAKLQAGAVAVGSSSARGDQIITQIFRLNHENANNLVSVLRPLISPNNTINANPGNNSLVITDYAENLQRLGRIIATMDTPGNTDIEIVPLKHAVASDLAALVQKLAAGGAANAAAAVPGQASGGISVLVDPRSNALILRASNPATLAATRAMVEKLDQPSIDGASNIRVVYLKNADATKLATVLRAAFAAGNSAAAGGNSNSSSSSSANNNSLGGAPLSGSNSGNNSSGTSTASSSPVSASQGPSTGGFVQADPATNSLIITAPEPLYRQIRAVIDQLDSRRAQIYVETMIVKVDASKSGQFGVQWQNLFGGKGDSNIPGLGTNFGTGLGNIINGSAAAAGGKTGIATALASAAVPQGLNIGFLKKVGDFYTLGAIANFLEGQAGANILSTPNLVALDNEEAKIVIGQNVPFLTGSYSNTGGSGSINPFQTIDRKDVGLTLRIRSQIGESGTVRMTVYQENSSVVDGKSSSAGPTTDKSSIETTVVVDDGQIIVLGGLMKDEYSDGEDKVPGLGSIPILGSLFKSENRKRVKTNLMVFLRPVVMRNQATADQLTLDRYESIRALQQNSQPGQSLVLPNTGAPVLPPSPATPAGGQSEAGAKTPLAPIAPQ